MKKTSRTSRCPVGQKFLAFDDQQKQTQTERIERIMGGGLRGFIKPASELTFSAANARKADKIARGW